MIVRPSAVAALLSAVTGIVLLGSAGSARANLTVVPTFDGTITTDPNAAAIESGINQVIAKLDSYIANTVTVNVTFAETNTGLGSSLTSSYSVPYSTYLTELQTQQTISPTDTIALTSLPAGPNNPVNGSSTVKEQTALARTLGYANAPGSDATISLNMSIINVSRTGTPNPSFYDLQAVAGHELDEVLGSGGPGSALQLTGSYTGQPSPTGAVGPLDLYRYSAAGVRSFTLSPSATSYFSINGGVTDLVHFNQNGADGADFADWGNGVPGAGNTSPNSPPLLQDAYNGGDDQLNMGPLDVTALDVIGYNLTPAGLALETGTVPEPTALGLIAVGTLGLVGRRRRA